MNFNFNLSSAAININFLFKGDAGSSNMFGQIKPAAKKKGGKKKT